MYIFNISLGFYHTYSASPSIVAYTPKFGLFLLPVQTHNSGIFERLTFCILYCYYQCIYALFTSSNPRGINNTGIFALSNVQKPCFWLCLVTYASHKYIPVLCLRVATTCVCPYACPCIWVPLRAWSKSICNMRCGYNAIADICTKITQK